MTQTDDISAQDSAAGLRVSSRFMGLLEHSATAWIVLLLSLLITALAWHLSNKAVYSKAQQRFSYQVEDISGAISRRFLEYETVLRGGAGLFNASEKVTRGEWRQYVSELRIQQNFPGIQGMGFSLMMPASKVESHVKSIRAEGFEDYMLKPSGKRDPSSAIIYLEPFDWRNQRAFGYDMFSEPTRRAAMTFAMDNGQPAISGRVKLLQETEKDVQYGFLMYVPVYRPGLPLDSTAERRAAIRGFVYAPFRMRDLMEGILGSDQKGIKFELFDGPDDSAEALLFENTHDKPADALMQSGEGDFAAQRPLQIGSRTWMLHVHAPEGYLAPQETWLPMVVAASGVAVNILLFINFLVIGRRKARAEILARSIATQLEESETRYQTLFKSAKAPMLLIDPKDGSIVDANPAALDFYGYELAALRALNIGDINTLSAEEIRVEMARAKNELRDHFFFSHRLSSGEIREVEVHSGPFRAGDHELLYSIIHDVTERKRIVAKLTESERRYSFAMAATGEGVWDWDIVGNVVNHNITWCRLLGLDDSRLSHPVEFFLSVIHHQDAAAVKAAVEAAIQNGAPYECEYRMVSSDGTVLWVRDRGKVVERDSNGTATRMVGSISDITLRTRQEAELQTQHNRLLNIIKGTRSGTWEWNPQTGAVFFNERWAEIVGYTLNELAPITIDTWLKLVHPDDLKRSEELLGDHFSGASSYYECEARMRHKDGHWVWVLDRGQVTARDEHGAPVAMAGTHQDITVLKLNEHKLQEARQAAETANVAKSQFLAAMSHEIRTPMNGILGMAQLLLMPDLRAEERQDYVRTIYTSGQALLSLLNDILDLSKVEAGRVELEKLAYSPSQLMHEITVLFDETAKQKGLTLEADTEGILPDARYWGDPTRLRQTLGNLVGNAIKFTAKGGVRLKVSINADVDQKRWLRFAVSDTGIGISLEDRARLFKPFSQVDGTITRRFGGTGLGLAISRSLSELMGGRIAVESEPGMGSIFWFDVPLDPVSPLDESRLHFRVMEAQESSQETLWGAGRHILLVEDVQTNRMIIETYLTKRGFVMASVENGQLAVDWVKAHPDVDLILMDSQMPVMDGQEATRQIRAWESAGRASKSLGRIPIVALTAEVFEDDQARCLAAGMDDFLAKPVSFADVDRVLARCLSWSAPQSSENALSKDGDKVFVPSGSEGADVVVSEELRALLLARMAELDDLLAKRMMKARKLAGEVAGSLPSLQLIREFSTVSDAIKQMDYEAARQCLQRFMAVAAWKSAEPHTVGENGGEQTISISSDASDDVAVMAIGEALERLGGDMSMLVEVARMLPIQFAEDQAMIRQAIRAEDHELLRKTAHRLKGSLGVVAAKVAVAASQKLELAAKNQEAATYEALEQAIANALSALYPVLEAFLQEHL